MLMVREFFPEKIKQKEIKENKILRKEEKNIELPDVIENNII
jgi:hypothetical protein